MRHIRWLVPLCLFSISIVLSYGLAAWIAEIYYFDKFFFYKSIQHGYWIPGKPLMLKDFGSRAEDLVNLEKDFWSKEQSNVLGTMDDQSFYTIAVIGDSYVWGQGVKFKETVSQLLEKQLSKYRKTKVLSLANAGDSILDYLLTFQMAKKIYMVDLYIFVLVDNDLLLKPSKEKIYSKMEIFTQCRDGFPGQSVVWSLDNIYTYLATQSSYLPLREAEMQIAHNLNDSWSNEINLCILDKSLININEERSIFFVSQYYYEEDKNWKKYINFLSKNNKTVMYITESKKLQQYIKYWFNPKENFTLSQKDGHPSRLLHHMYAELLSQEILHNPRWRFSYEDEK